MNINIIGTAKPLSFAAEELCRILQAVGIQKCKIEKQTSYKSSLEGLWLACFDDLKELDLASDKNNVFDDELYIYTKGTNGIIAGISPRSILIAVYRYATELGCRFLSVGKDGEYFPQIDLGTSQVCIHEHPSYRHRGVCIEGSVSMENVIEMIDFLPKLGMNSYFIQFREAYTFFERWYRHRLNPLLESKEPYPVEDARSCVATIAEEMARRGILFHAVGHGWTCEPFGVPGLSWEEWTGELDNKTLENFALINGKRQLWGGVPLNTSACYSNPAIRHAMVEDICNYIKEHPTLDIIHVWLADGENNQCECEACLAHIPADWYLILLNELDVALAALNLDTKIVFLLYVDLLWPPKTEILNNQDRFLLMFAPITRSYRKSFFVEGQLPEIAEYSRNKNVMPSDVALNVAYLKAWQKVFSGDGFDFDYHFMWAHFNDPGFMKISEILCEDIKLLHQLDLNGYISCQVGRAMFPNAINMVAMGKALWNREVSFENIAEDYFAHAYGTRAASVRSYLETLSNLYFDINLETESFPPSKERAALRRKVLEHIDAFDFGNDDSIYFRYLRIHGDVWYRFTDILLHIFEDDLITAKSMWDTFQKFIWALEPEVQPVFDIWNFINIVRRFRNFGLVEQN